MKKVLAIFALILSLSLSLALTACGDDTDSSGSGSGAGNGSGSGSGNGGSPDVHTHTPAEPVTENEIPATCKDEGSYDEVVYCSDCSLELSRETKSVAKSTNHTFVDGACTVCGKPKPSDGLSYTSNFNGTCFVSNVGSCTDKNVIIPEYAPDGSKVIAIGKNAFSGAYYAESSIHINVWFAPYDKRSALEHFMKALYNVDSRTLKEESVYLGDSYNDQPMFQFIPLSRENTS